MIVNNNLPTEYGTFTGLTKGTQPIPYKPAPSASDYANGSISRVFAKKLNNNAVVEIQNQQASNINEALYQVVYLNWIISGSQNNAYNGKIIEQFGVRQQNLYEIARVKTENGADLSNALANPLEFWRGY